MEHNHTTAMAIRLSLLCLLALGLLALTAGLIPLTAHSQGPTPGAMAGQPLPDLGVTFTQRQPLYHEYQLEYQTHDRSGYLSDYGRYCWPGCVNPRLVPGTEGDKRWPDPGEPVTLTAHVRNHGLGASPAFSYAWRLDGVLLEQGTLPALAAGAQVSTNLVLPWPHGRSADGQRVLGEHTVSFAADPQGALAESTELNNRRQDRTDALAMVVWVSQAVYDQMRLYRNPDGETYSFEDWEQWHVDQYNRIFSQAVFPLTPGGVSQRLRLDRIRICPTDTDCYSEEERQQQDGYWAHPSLEEWYIKETLAPGMPDWPLLHEWGHQLGLMDLYWVGTVPYMEALFQRPDGAFVGQATSCEEWSSERYDLALDSQGYVYLQAPTWGGFTCLTPFITCWVCWPKAWRAAAGWPTRARDTRRLTTRAPGQSRIT
jgi:hypothetical protein